MIPVCSSPLCPGEVAPPAECPYLNTGDRRHNHHHHQWGWGGGGGERLTSRDHSSVCVDQRPHVMRVVLKGPGSDPLLLLLSHGGGQELELDHGSLGGSGYHTALILGPESKL